jgi:DNA-binding XRE family transcriptional regulator
MMAKKKIREKPNRFKGLLDEVKDWKAGKIRWKTTLLEKDGTRTVFEESLPESRKREANSVLLKSIRAELDLTQAEMAKALHVSPRSIQGWEIGRPIPEPVLVLAELLHDVPAVRKRLLAA